MLAQFLQFLLSGITVGASYALVALGFSIIYNASHVINFAQGEFVMIGGMTTWFLMNLGLPPPLAALAAVIVAVGVGVLLERLAIEPARDSSVITLIIITIGASIFLRGLAQWIWDKEYHAIPPFSGDRPLSLAGAAVQPQGLWVVAGTAALVSLLWFFFERTRTGKAMLATAHNALAARLVGIEPRLVWRIAFGLSALLGAVAGILIAPISATYSDVGIMLGLKGFSAAILGGLGRAGGAVAGGLLLGIAETMGAGYLSSQYKDAIAFVLLLLVLMFLPRGLFGGGSVERV